MPKTKVQGVIFGLIMSYAMAYGMEVFNVAVKWGLGADLSGMTNGVFLGALEEASYMGLFVFLFSNLWGNRFGAWMMLRRCNPEKDNPFVCQIVRQGCTVAIMCPTMSLVASILFSVILAGRPVSQLPAIWAGTRIKIFPIAYFLNFFPSSPFTHVVFRLLFGKRNAAVEQ
ncbi:MAG: hypothetical protein LUB58_05295 [Oscillospiraceae bacterium]|nr:hypothetical protein [Oscillospiraceae bacterium]